MTTPAERIDLALRRVYMTTKARADTERIAAAAAADQANTIREAFSEGVNATELMRVTGLSKARIYQIKDGTR